MTMYSSALKMVAVLAVSLLVFSSCLPNNEQDIAYIQMTAEFVDAESTEVLVDVNINIFAHFSDSSEPFYQGTGRTNDNGQIFGSISYPNEVTVERLIFELLIDGESIVVEEDVDLQMKYEEPFEEADLFFEVDTSVEEE